VDQYWSEDYVAALYNSDRVIIEKVDGEPAPTKKLDHLNIVLAILGIVASATVLLLIILLRFAPFESFSVVRQAGCDLRVVTTYNRIEEGSNIRVIQHRIFNAGQSCVVKSAQLDPKGPFTIGAGDTIKRERLAQSRPKLIETEVYVGATGTDLQKTLIPLYSEP